MPADWFQDVLGFHKKFGCKIGSTPADPGDDGMSFRFRLVFEEIDELAKAMREKDMPGVADAIGDAIYVLLGTAVTYGIDMRPVWDTIQRSNMAKEGGGTRADGKILKPPGWVPPDIEGVLAAQGPLEI